MNNPPSNADPKQRFSDRVENYIKYRPTYPPAVLAFLERSAGLAPQSIVADVGSGTGISSRLFLDYGAVVYGIEPNAAMRAAAKRLLAGFETFRSIDGTAEATTLADGSVDLVVAGQAFHWFDARAAAGEFRRILHPGGNVALLWNTRKTRGSPFLEAYEDLLLEYGTDYGAVRHENVSEAALGEFFSPAGYAAARFPNAQTLTHHGLLGRLLSSSYAPAPGHARHEAMVQALQNLFDAFNAGGLVEIEYETQVYVGMPSPM